jgi:hypothetical protein
LLDLHDGEDKRSKEQEKEGLSSVAWFIRDVLTQEKIADKKMVADLEEIIRQFPEFAKSEKLTRDLRNNLYDRLEAISLTPTESKNIIDKIIETLVKVDL